MGRNGDEGDSRTLQLEKGLITHSSIDNIDEETESISLHFTNSNIFQPNTKAVSNSSIRELANIKKNHPGSIEELPDVHIEKKKDPPPMPGYVDSKTTDMIDKRFSIDIIWSILGNLPIVDGNENTLVGPWTHFMKQISEKSFDKMSLQCDTTGCKWLRSAEIISSLSKDTTDNLEIKHIFSHADEAVFSKLLEIIWSSGTQFEKVIPAKTTKSMSAAEKAIQGKHYNMTTRVYKEIFDVIIQMRVDEITNQHLDMDKDLYDALVNARYTWQNSQIKCTLNAHCN